MVQDDECATKGVTSKLDDNKVIVPGLTEYGEDCLARLYDKEGKQTLLQI